MDNDNAQFSQMNTGGTALFLKQPPKIMGLNSYFMEPPNIGGTTGTGDGGEYTPILREVYNLRTATQSSLLQFQNNTLNTMEDLQHEVIEIRKSVADINKILNKSIKQQEKFQEEQFKRQKLADRYQKQLDNQNRKYKFSTPSMSKSIARGTGNVASDIVGGLLDTLLPGFSRAGGTKLIMKGIKAGTTGLIGLLFGTKTSDKVQKQVTTSLGDTIGLSPSSKSKKTNVSGLFKNMSKLFSSKKGGRTVTADVLDEAGNVVGKTTATVSGGKKVGLIGRMFGQASDYTKNLFRSFNKNMITKPSTALSTSVKTAGTGLVRSFGAMGKSVTEVAVKGMGTAMRGLGTAVGAIGRGLMTLLSNPWGLVIAGLGLTAGITALNFNDFIKNPENHPFFQKMQKDHPVLSGLFGLGTGEEYAKKHPILNKLVDKRKTVKDKKGVGLPQGLKATNIPGVGKNLVALADLDLIGDISNPAMSKRDTPYVSANSAQGLKLLDTTLGGMGIKFMYTSAMGGKHASGASNPKSHAGGGKVDVQTVGRVLTPAEYTQLFKQGHFGGTTGALGYEYAGMDKNKATSPQLYEQLYKAGKVTMGSGNHYDFTVRLSQFASALNTATANVQSFGAGIKEATVDKFEGNLSSNPAFSSEQDFYSTVALRTMDKRASEYDSTASGISEYKTQMERMKDPNSTITDEDVAYGTRRIESQYTTPPIQINGDSSVSTPDINMTMLEFIQLQLQS